MIKYDVSAKGLSAHLGRRHEERRARVVRAIHETVATHGLRIAQEVVDATRPLPVDRGEYRRSFEAYETSTGAVFLNSAAYASIVERGRRPGKFPPRDVIERWVRRKFRLRISQLRKSSRGRDGASRDAEVRSIAFLVARKIARRGIQGKHVMARVEAQLTPLVNEAVAKAMVG